MRNINFNGWDLMIGMDNKINQQFSSAFLLLNALQGIKERKNGVLGMNRNYDLVSQADFTPETTGLKKPETFPECQDRLNRHLSIAAGQGALDNQKALSGRGIQTIETQKRIMGNLKGTLCQIKVEELGTKTLTEELSELYKHREALSDKDEHRKLIKAALIAETLKVEEERTLTGKLELAGWEGKENVKQLSRQEIGRLRNTVLTMARYPELSKIQQLTSGAGVSQQNVSRALIALRRLPANIPTAFIMQAAHTTFYGCHKNKDQQQQAQFRQIVQTWPEDLQDKFKAHWQNSGLEVRYPFTPPAEVPEKVTESLPRSQKQAENAKSALSEHKTEVSAEEQKQSEKTKTAGKTEQVPPSGNKAEALIVSGKPVTPPQLQTTLSTAARQHAVTSGDEDTQQKTTSATKMSIEDAPFDTNLECPTCKRLFKIGRIQDFREHVAEEERKAEAKKAEERGEPASGYSHRTAVVSSNPLEQNIEDEIMAEVMYRVNETEVPLTSLKGDSEIPFDPNLICPLCKKNYRLGEIQSYSEHVRSQTCI